VLEGKTGLIQISRLCASISISTDLFSQLPSSNTRAGMILLLCPEKKRTMTGKASKDLD
jgi:hypothetical protein